nr:hypothetical protein [Tanacetum cinerariifolium]
MPKVLSLAWEKFFEIQHAFREKQHQPADIYELLRKLLKDLQIISEELAEYIYSPSWNCLVFYDDDDDEQSIIEEYRQREQSANLSTHTPEPSRHFNSICYDDDDDEERTIPLRDIISQLPSSIVITTSPLVLPIEDPEDTSGSDSACILPSCDDFSSINVFEEKAVTFSNHLFNLNDDFTSSDDESLFDEDVPEENIKIYSNLFFEFDDEYISSDVNPLFDEVMSVSPESDNVELLLHRDPSIPTMSVASILEGFTDKPPLEENDDLFDLESKENEWKKILYDAPINDLMTEDNVFDPEDCLDFKASHARGFVLRSLELQSLAYRNPIS